MDAMGLLGSLMGGGGMASGLGGQLIGGLLGGGGAPGGGQTGSSGFGSKAVMGVLGGLAVTALTKYASGKMSGGGDGGGAMSALGGLFGGDEAPPSHDYDDDEANSRAEFLIRAMVNAAKADGRVDEQEEQNILQRLGDIGQEEADFLRDELTSPLDTQGFIRSIPRGMEREVYAMSLLGIELDEQAEAEYLSELAQGLGLSGDDCNAMHRDVGAPEIFQ